MKANLISTALFTCTAVLLAGCKKAGEAPGPRRDAIVRLSVLDEHGHALGGVSILIFDEKGYEQFEKDRNTQPADRTITRPDGRADYRFPYATWLKNGNRFVTFVIYEKLDENSYRIWSSGRTIAPAKEERIEFTIENQGIPDVPQGTQLDMYDENNGRTLFGGAVYLDAEHHFVGANRYSLIDMGDIKGMVESGELRLDNFTNRVAARADHGYFVCKDISLQEFPSGKWGMSIAAEYAKVYVAEPLYHDDKSVGVRLRYTIHKPDRHGLPEWGHIYEASLADGAAVTIQLPEDPASYEFAALKDQSLEFRKESGQVTVRITDEHAEWGNIYPFLIRSGAYYTEVSIETTD